jgi:ribosomal protein S18 acetylase RimI-like enzyme
MRVITAQASDQVEAIQLLFQHLKGPSILSRIRAAQELLNDSSARLLIARQGRDLIGASLTQVLPGATGVLWPPQARLGNKDRELIENALLEESLRWLQQQGARLVQAILSREEAHLAASLLRGGFIKPTRLRYLRYEPDSGVITMPVGQFLSYRDASANLFHDTMMRSYQGSLDFPEVDGRRSLTEILQGYQSSGFSPDRWWVRMEKETPVGVLLLSDIEPKSVWDLTYIGVVPESRRLGHGRELVRKAVTEAQAAGVELLTVCVDERNLPALHLYAKLGFEEYDIREVFLLLWEGK